MDTNANFSGMPGIVIPERNSNVLLLWERGSASPKVFEERSKAVKAGLDLAMRDRTELTYCFENGKRI